MPKSSVGFRIIIFQNFRSINKQLMWCTASKSHKAHERMRKSKGIQTYWDAIKTTETVFLQINWKKEMCYVWGKLKNAIIIKKLLTKLTPHANKSRECIQVTPFLQKHFTSSSSSSYTRNVSANFKEENVKILCTFSTFSLNFPHSHFKWSFASLIVNQRKSILQREKKEPPLVLSNASILSLP